MEKQLNFLSVFYLQFIKADKSVDKFFESYVDLIFTEDEKIQNDI